MFPLLRRYGRVLGITRFKWSYLAHTVKPPSLCLFLLYLPKPHERKPFVLEQQPLPIWSSPMGPLGQVQAFVFYLGSLFFGVYNYLVQTHGYSPAMAAFIFAFGGMITGLVTMIAVAIMLSAKVKED